MDVTFAPVDGAHWPDLERLFLASAGESLGNPSRCWCMEWRLQSRDEWREGAGDVNHRKMRERVEGGDVPGIVVYADGQVDRVVLHLPTDGTDRPERYGAVSQP
jgi:hypothetical protein